MSPRAEAQGGGALALFSSNGAKLQLLANCQSGPLHVPSPIESRRECQKDLETHKQKLSIISWRRDTEPGWEEGELGLVEKQKRKDILDEKEQSYRMSCPPIPDTRIKMTLRLWVCKHLSVFPEHRRWHRRIMSRRSARTV